MNDDGAEPMSNEELLNQTRAIRDQLKPRAAELRELGIEVDSFLEACYRVIAFLEGRSEEWVDVGEFIEKLQAFHQEMREFHEIEKQAERAKAVGSIPGMLDVTEDMARRLDNPNDARTVAAFKAAVAAARERLARGEVPTEELEDISLSFNAQAAEMNRRNKFRFATMVLFWESRPPEWWAKRSDEERKGIESLLTSWRTEREKILGEMPIEDRRRLETLRPEDFDDPDRLKP